MDTVLDVSKRTSPLRHLLHFLAPVLTAVVLVACGRAMPASTSAQPVEQLFARRCASCHGPNGQGAGAIPNIAGAVTRLGASQVHLVVTNGRGSMPGFGSQLSAAQIDELIAHLSTLDD